MMGKWREHISAITLATYLYDLIFSQQGLRASADLHIFHFDVNQEFTTSKNPIETLRFDQTLIAKREKSQQTKNVQK
jgi:hypothetical protein